MPHKHLSLHGLGRFQGDAHHNDDGGAADGQGADPDDVAGDDGGDGDHRQIQGPEEGDLVQDLVDKVGGGLAGTEAGMNPPFFLRLLATSTGLNCMVE